MAGKAGGFASKSLAVALAAALALSMAAPPALAANLRPSTAAAFDRYAALTQQRFQEQLASGGPFLWIDTLPAARRDAAYASLRAGNVVIEKMETLDNGKPIPVPGGLIHHWIGTVFIPGATLSETLTLEKDYNHHQTYFQPDVIRSKILRQDGDDYVVLLRFKKQKIVTVILDTEHVVHYQPIDATRAASWSHTTRIQQVENAGAAEERMDPPGQDDGFLWRMNTYWKFEQKDGGTYVESQSVSLTRDIPMGLGWMIGPFVESIPRESLTFTLSATRSAVLSRLPAPASR
ncbi:MAG TPA: hypothetical protein VMJ93_00355 [Verrucomicrobiae bacterium]|nr:hypothetical protein [Verrucomicrobiae bacterium]